MTIVLNGTTGITTPDMTSDGGLTADGVSFASGAPANTLVTTSTGNVGIGTSSPTAKATVASANTAISSRGNLYVYSTDTATADYGGMLSLGGSYSGTSEVPFANIAGRWTGSGINGYMQFSTLASGTLYERARIDSSGNVGIGTTTPGISRLYVHDAVDRSMDANGAGQISIGGSGYNAGFALNTNGLNIYTNSSSRGIIFGTDETERARIDASGNLLVGTTSVNGKFAVTGAAGGSTAWFSTAGVGAHCIVGFQSHNAAGYDVKIYMECPGSNLGGFTYQRSTSRLYAWNSTENSGPYVIANGTSWTTNSDERLKTDIADISYGLNAVLALSPKQYKYKTGNKTSLGLIAQQTASVIPEIVDVPEDPELMMGIEYTGLIPVLVKAIQEQQAIIEQLRADVAVLKAKA